MNPETPETTPPSPPVEAVDPNNPPAWVQHLVAGLVQAQSAPPWLEALLKTQQQVADTLKEHTKPKNDDNPPRISPFNPRGDRDFPRPELKCDLRLANVSFEKSTLTYEEIELLNRLEPGEYWVRKTDGSEEIARLVPTHNPATGELIKLNISIDVKDEAGNKKHGWPSLANLCRQILGEPEVHQAPKRMGSVRRAAKPGEADLTDAVIAAQRADVRAALESMVATKAEAV